MPLKQRAAGAAWEKMPNEMIVEVLTQACPLARGAFAGTSKANLQLVKEMVKADPLLLDRWELAAGLAGMPADSLSKGVITWEPYEITDLTRSTVDTVSNRARRNTFLSLDRSGCLRNVECSALDELAQHAPVYMTGLFYPVQVFLPWGTAVLVGQTQPGQTHNLDRRPPVVWVVPIILGTCGGRLLRGALTFTVSIRKPFNSRNKQDVITFGLEMPWSMAPSTAVDHGAVNSWAMVGENRKDIGAVFSCLRLRACFNGVHGRTMSAAGDMPPREEALLLDSPLGRVTFAEPGIARRWPLTTIQAAWPNYSPNYRQMPNMHRASHRSWVAAAWQVSTLPSVGALSRRLYSASRSLPCVLPGGTHADPGNCFPWPLQQTLSLLSLTVSEAAESLVTTRLAHYSEKKAKELRFVCEPRPHKERRWLNKNKIKQLLKARPLEPDRPLEISEAEDALVRLLGRAAEAKAEVSMERAERALLAHVGLSD